MLGVALGGQDLLADSSFSNRSFTPETTKPSHFCGGFVLYGAAPDERYVSAGLGFSGVWSSLENSAYPN